MADICPNCEKEYQQLGKHWVSCGYPDLTNEQREIITGCLMGDGTIDQRDRNNPRFTLTNTNKEYAKFVHGKLQPFSTLNEKETENKTQTIVRITHPWISNLADWYSSGEKKFPNIELTPTILKHWFCCDGCKQTTAHGGERFHISAANESERPQHTTDIFKTADIEVSVSNNDVYSPYGYTKAWKYMGNPPPGMKYKWPDN